jgi:hypothetical protein
MLELIIIYVAGVRVRVRVSYPIWKILKTSDMDAAIYSKLLYKNINKLYNK